MFSPFAGMLALFALAAAPQPAIKIVPNLAYKPGANLTEYETTRCKLDLYLPEGKKGFPVLVWFHGGGLEGGDKESAKDIGRWCAENGFAAAVPSYRLSPKAKSPAYVEDAAAAVAWTAAHIAEYGGNPRSLFISGHSAGGYLAAIVGTDPRWLKAAGYDLSRVAGIIPVSGQMVTHYTIRKERGIPDSELRPVIDEMAPCYNASKDGPPFFCIYAEHDMAMRAEENRYFVELMKTFKHPDVSGRLFTDRDHGSIAGKIHEPNDPVGAAILDFIAKHNRPATAAP